MHKLYSGKKQVYSSLRTPMAHGQLVSAKRKEYVNKYSTQLDHLATRCSYWCGPHARKFTITASSFYLHHVHNI